MKCCLHIVDKLYDSARWMYIVLHWGEMLVYAIENNSKVTIIG
jgi:hypothetical protein